MDDDTQKVIAGTIVLVALVIVLTQGDIKNTTDAIGNVGNQIASAFKVLQGRG